MVGALDLTNQRFGKLLVLRRVENDAYGSSRWLCQCDCRSEPKAITGKRLRAKKGPTRSCGCIQKEKVQLQTEDLTNQVFGALTAKEYIPGSGRQPGERKPGMWKCTCDCGETVMKKPQQLKVVGVDSSYRSSCGAPRCAADSECIGPILPIEISRERGLKTYFPGIRCSAGHFSEHVTSNQSCMICHLRRGAEFQKANPEKISEYGKKHKAKPESKARRNSQLTKRRSEDTTFYIAEKCRNRVKMVFRKEAMPKTGESSKLLGIDDWEKLKAHIESQFGDSYSWDNRDQWHIDHIRPISSFDVTDEVQQLVAFNWRNLQPLWGLDNLSKNDNYDPSDEVAWASLMRDLGYDGELFLLFEEGRGGL